MEAARITYLSVAQVLRIHTRQLARFGGSAGLRDRGLLESACARPTMTFGGQDLYPDLPTKAAALMHSLISNHAFVDGNKRVGGAAAVVFLKCNGMQLRVSQEMMEKTALAVAGGRIGVEELTIWLRQNSREDK